MNILFAFPEQQSLADSLMKFAAYENGAWQWRPFPDGESYIRVLSDVRGRDVTLLCSLNQPDSKTLPLIFLARTLKEMGCNKITLFTPYLGYMRQDARFHDGEAITSNLFASLLSPEVDELVTVDPHLHRHKTMEEIYSCRCKVLSAAQLMAQWIAKSVPHALVIGPDGESEQWVRMVAAEAKAPHVILSKVRHGDRDIELSLPEVETYRGKTPVLVDDIISTGVTVMQTIALLRQKGFGETVCLATHGVFAGDAYTQLLNRGGVRVITSNTITHASNGFDVASLFM